MDSGRPKEAKSPKDLEILYIRLDKKLYQAARKRIPKRYRKSKQNLALIGAWLIATMPEAEIEKYLKAEIK